jgi:hypothetical protein
MLKVMQHQQAAADNLEKEKKSELVKTVVEMGHILQKQPVADLRSNTTHSNHSFKILQRGVLKG